MAIKIDLLPEYVGLKRRRNNYILLAVVVWLCLSSGLFYLWFTGDQARRVAQRDVANIERIALAAEAAQTAQQSADAVAAPYEAVSRFITSASQTGPQRAALLELVRKSVTGAAVVSTIDISDGQNVNIAATVNTPTDYARTLLSMRQASLSNGGQLYAADPRTNSVVLNGLPGYPATKPEIPAPGLQPRLITFPLNITARGILQFPVIVPAAPTPSGGAAPGGAAGGGLPGGGLPGGGPPGLPGAPVGPPGPPGARTPT